MTQSNSKGCSPLDAAGSARVRPEPTASAQTPHWADLVAGLVRQEIDAGRLVRVALPGASVPILVEDAWRWVDCLGLKDPQGARYYTASPAGVVVLAEAVKGPAGGERPYWMQVDE